MIRPSPTSNFHQLHIPSSSSSSPRPPVLLLPSPCWEATSAAIPPVFSSAFRQPFRLSSSTPLRSCTPKHLHPRSRHLSLPGSNTLRQRPLLQLSTSCEYPPTSILHTPPPTPTIHSRLTSLSRSPSRTLSCRISTLQHYDHIEPKFTILESLLSLSTPPLPNAQLSTRPTHCRTASFSGCSPLHGRAVRLRSPLSLRDLLALPGHVVGEADLVNCC